eukprot:SAG31_NODE_2185_length_6243_cov_3.811035_2_plen_78_part_00
MAQCLACNISMFGCIRRFLVLNRAFSIIVVTICRLIHLDGALVLEELLFMMNIINFELETTHHASASLTRFLELAYE